MQFHQHHGFLQEHLRSVVQHDCEKKIMDVFMNQDPVAKPFSSFEINYSQR